MNRIPHGKQSLDHPRPPSRAGRWLSLAIALVVVAGAVAGRFGASEATEPPPLPQAAVGDTLARAPSGVRVRVRVLNITTTRGLAKRATTLLRQFGYDVVDYDTDIKPAGSPTRILAHTGKTDVAQRLRRALGSGAIEASADSLRYVDFTVLIGSDWKPPTQPFRP